MQHSNKPRRPECKDPLFEVEEKPVVIKHLNAWQRQRLQDGTPHTRIGITSLRPPDVELTLREGLVQKGSLVEKYASRPKPPEMDPDPMATSVGVVKKFLEQPTKEEAVNKAHYTALIENMNRSIEQVLVKAGVKKPGFVQTAAQGVSSGAAAGGGLAGVATSSSGGAGAVGGQIGSRGIGLATSAVNKLASKPKTAEKSLEEDDEDDEKA